MASQIVIRLGACALFAHKLPTRTSFHSDNAIPTTNNEDRINIMPMPPASHPAPANHVTSRIIMISITAMYMTGGANSRSNGKYSALMIKSVTTAVTRTVVNEEPTFLFLS